MVRIQRILCPVDFFPASLRAVDYAIGLAQKYDAKLHLLHVVSSTLGGTEQCAFTVSEIIDSMKKQSARKMKNLERKARAVGLTVSTDVRTGDVQREVESAIRASKADILVMGTHGRRGLEKWFMGSVTERMLRRSPIPVLTLRGSKKARTTLPTRSRILFTTDFSEGTANALNYALSVAQANKGRLTLLHVLEDTLAVISAQYRKEISEGVRRELKQLIPADAQGSPDIDTVVEAGTPYYMILRLLKKERIDLLVMNTHGKGMLDRALLGSTSERVVRAADCPVMLIPPMKAAKSSRRTQRRAA
jgi:nucleotide-binding universal stress UspA family protein